MNPSGTRTLTSSGSSEGLARVTLLEIVYAIVYITLLVYPFSSILQLVSLVPTFQIPILIPIAIGIPLFEGANTTEFLDRYKDLCR
jgi:hypothetical protein